MCGAAPYDGRAKGHNYLLSYLSDDHGSQMQLGKYEPAIAAFDTVIRNYSRSSEVPDAYVRKGTALKTLRQPDKAREAFEFVIKNYPDSVAATVAQQRLQELLTQKP